MEFFETLHNPSLGQAYVGHMQNFIKIGVPVFEILSNKRTETVQF